MGAMLVVPTIRANVFIFETLLRIDQSDHRLPGLIKLEHPIDDVEFSGVKKQIQIHPCFGEINTTISLDIGDINAILNTSQRCV